MHNTTASDPFSLIMALFFLIIMIVGAIGLTMLIASFIIIHTAIKKGISPLVVIMGLGLAAFGIFRVTKAKKASTAAQKWSY